MCGSLTVHDSFGTNDYEGMARNAIGDAMALLKVAQADPCRELWALSMAARTSAEALSHAIEPCKQSGAAELMALYRVCDERGQAAVRRMAATQAGLTGKGWSPVPQKRGEGGQRSRR